MKKPKFAWSFSVLSLFQTCRKKYWHLKVQKDFRDADSDAAQEGKEIHDAMFKRVIKGKALPTPLRPFEKWAARFANAKGKKHGEMKLCLNINFEPVAWFADDAWVRAIIDLLILKDKTAILVDWKTGKVREDFAQLRLSAAILSRYHPEVEEFVLVFVWLNAGKVSTYVMKADEIKNVWTEMLPEVVKINDAYKTTEFPAEPSGLCGWCPVNSCPHWFERD